MTAEQFGAWSRNPFQRKDGTPHPPEVLEVLGPFTPMLEDDPTPLLVVESDLPPPSLPVPSDPS